jgi:hypothetical protein
MLVEAAAAVAGLMLVRRVLVVEVAEAFQRPAALGEQT